MYGVSNADSFSSTVPGKKPKSLVGTTLLTITSFLILDLLNTFSSARYRETKVLPVPALPLSIRLSPSFHVLKTSSWFLVVGSILFNFNIHYKFLHAGLTSFIDVSLMSSYLLSSIR